MALEQKLQDKIIKYLRKNEVRVIKVVAATRAGVPDIIACYKGRHIEIEVKSPTGKLTDLQILNLADCRGHGGIALVARDLDCVKNLLKELSEK